jgi:murein DD-endopeptidase MepM/ murein hydrolase activator NlpD
VRGATRLGMITYGSGAGVIDLGNEPPLIVGDVDDDDDAHVRRAVSWRWMGGTVLTGLTSICLMGGALIVALSNPDQFASLPDSFISKIFDDDGIVFGKKGDRLRPTEERVASRQVLQVSTVTRQGERDFIKLKPFARVTASLAVRGEEFAAKVPEYDPLRIFADTSEPEAPTQAPETSVAAAGDQLHGAAVDGEVAVKVSAFPDSDADLEPTVVLDSSEVEQIVRAAAHLPGSDADPSVAYADGSPVDDGAPGGDPFAALGVSIVPENVSSIAKSDAGGEVDAGYSERIIAVSRNENLRSLFEDNQISGDDADEIIVALSQLIDVSRLRPGQKVRVAFAADPVVAAATALVDPMADPADAAPPPARPIRVSIYDDGAHQATVARADNNVFVRADEPSYAPELFAEVPAEETPAVGGPPRIYDALYQTALEQQIPVPLIDQLIRVFAFDVDFQSRVSPGDAIEVFHSLPDPTDAEAAEPEVLFASLNLGGVAKRFYRFRTGDDSVVDYYDEEGKSAKKFLMRKPMTVGVLRSGFGSRVHPILGYRRMHTGVDYAAPKGTPILAAGNGIVEKVGPSSGYGNLTVIRHTNGYETAYGHQSAFAKGIVPGARVRQGQVIGYVGSTGLSTGPHLHFEIRVNGQPVDPLRIRLPRGRVLEGDYLVAFEHERQRIDALLGIETSPGIPTKVASVLAE